MPPSFPTRRSSVLGQEVGGLAGIDCRCRGLQPDGAEHHDGNKERSREKVPHGATPRTTGPAQELRRMSALRPTVRRCGSRFPGTGGKERSEEHTSELQSLMRISYAVFCLKK